jgi:hypothetical protein
MVIGQRLWVICIFSLILAVIGVLTFTRFRGFIMGT